MPAMCRVAGECCVKVTAVSFAVLVPVLTGVLGFVVGLVVNRAAGAFPWSPRPHHRGRVVEVDARVGSRLAVRQPVLELGTAALFALAALRFGFSWELPAFLFLAGVAMLLAVIDVQHLLLPNRVVLPAIGIGALLLVLAAAPVGEWAALGRAVLGAVVLFAAFLVLALIAPSGLGMGDVKLAGLLGLYLGWLGWPVLALGAAAGFVVQALLAAILLAGRRVGRRGEIPFGPAMLVGALVAIAEPHVGLFDYIA
jgi:leader peptidase (prepilin peptidase)/N-methyltransferase